MVRAWRNDPIAQSEILRSDPAAQDFGAVKMTATCSRHEQAMAPN